MYNMTGGFLNALLVLFLSGYHLCQGEFTDEWAVQIPGGDHFAEQVARDNQFTLIRKVFDDIYVFRHNRVVKRSADPSMDQQVELLNNPYVTHAEQQLIKRRTKRDFINNDIWSFLGYISENKAEGSISINDPMWSEMWYLKRGPGLDMNVQKAWEEGVTGKGVVVTILDDGIERNNPDLIKNYDPAASYDINDGDDDPMPRYDFSNTNRHGTRCAGVVAATVNNSFCAMGIAYDSSVGGVRLLDGDVTDLVEFQSLAHNPQHVDIYTSSWGPDDDGRTVEGPGWLTLRAFAEGIKKGRGGLGSIFIWASGNGGRYQDNCNCDGYSSSIWTISVSAVSESGDIPWYGEMCSSTLASTYSSGSNFEQQVVSTDLNHGCTNRLTGSSASAPMAAALCALALQVNKNLSWRDMQHIIVRTARAENLNDSDWRKNAVGREYSHSFGYGLMDGYGMVRLARSWTPVPDQLMCTMTYSHGYKVIPQSDSILLELDVYDCPEINYLEHVQAQLTVNSDHRGSIEIVLTSPGGTESTLVTRRSRDNSVEGFKMWHFTTVHMWGEKPHGNWKLEIKNWQRLDGMRNLFDPFCLKCGYAAFESWVLILYGTKRNPDICNELLLIPNGTIKKNLTTNTAEITCQAGYKLLGSATIICLVDNGWKEPLPRCVSTPCPPPDVPSNAILAGRSMWWVGDVAEYSCKIGYALKGNANLTCQSGDSDQGKWGHEVPVCEEVKCPMVHPPENGNITLIQNKFLKKKGDYNAKKYQRRRSTGQQNIDRVQRLGSNLDDYEFINFESDENFLEGELSIRNSNIIIGAKFGSTIRYECDTNFVLLGFASRTCTKNGSWDYPEPVCYRKYCSLVNTIENGKFTYIGSGIDSTVMYSCNTGYVLIGPTERICQVDKKWTGDAPVCIKVDCGEPGSYEPATVEYNSTSVGSIATYICPHGYKLKGSVIRICTFEGNWSSEVPVCEKVMCPAPVSFENGMISSSSQGTFYVDSTLIYECDEYSILSGLPIRICQDDGTWTSESPVCKRRDVSDLFEFIFW